MANPAPARNDDTAPASRRRKVLRLTRVDRDADRGSYWEPNVWMIHPDTSSGEH